MSIKPFWRPHPGPQTNFLRRREYEVLFGGAAGPGKTDCLIWAALRYWDNPNCNAVIFRRTFPMLQEVIDRTREYVPAVDPGAKWKESEKRWIGSSGAKFHLSHMQHENDRYDHQGKQYTFCGFDELTQFTETQYLYLHSRVRSTDPSIVKMIRATSNPGGVGHYWVKKRFRIGTVEPGTVIHDEVLGQAGELISMPRVFIPATLDDNPTLTENDPTYVARLELLPEMERNRLRYGLWDAFEGQAFPELNRDVHGFGWDIPPEWDTFGSFDWGSSAPWSYGLWASDYDGNIYRFAELYGAKKDGEEYIDEGLRMNDVDIARQILELERDLGCKPRYRVADPAIWSRRPRKEGAPGPSPEETMAREGCYFIKGDNNRIAGRREFHNRLRLGDDGKPRMYIHYRCKAFWQTIPTLIEDPRNPEDVLSKDTQDHVYDEAKYGILSRPTKSTPKKIYDIGSFQWARRKHLETMERNRKRGGITTGSTRY